MAVDADEYNDRWVRILDHSGLCWEDEVDTLEQVLLATEKWAEQEIEERFKKKRPK